MFIVNAFDFISPFRSVKSNHWIEGKEDNTSYELTHFCKLCAQGNPSALELLVAPTTDVTDEGDELIGLLPSFLSKRCVTAFFGYSRNNEKKFRDDHMGRRWKYAEAQTRTLLQLMHLLEHGELSIGWGGATLEELCNIKRGKRTESEVMSRILSLENVCRDLEKKSSLPEGPDIAAIEKFIAKTYLTFNAA